MEEGKTVGGLSDLESVDKESKISALKADPHGLPLVPQPSDFKDDPLNWPKWLKWVVLLQVSFMAFLGPFNAAVPNPSFVLLGKAFRRPVEIITYSTTTAIITGGVAPFIWIPLTNIYGRRPIALLVQLITIWSHIGSARSQTFAALLVCRAINGIGFGGMMSIGTPVLNDMFFLHERGKMTGIYTVFVTNGAHVAVMAGGFLGQKAGWQWDFYMPAIVVGFSFLVSLFAFPETLFSHDDTFLRVRRRSHERSFKEMLFNIRGNMIPQRRLRLADFFTSLQMLKYPSIAIPFWFYTWSWTFINILPAITMAKIYSTLYGFQSGQIGLCTGIPLTIGSLIGELSAGRLSDFIMYRKARANNGKRKPEHRLYPTFLSAFLGPIGMIAFGICLQIRTMYILPLIGLGIGVCGLQITSTCLYAYVSDCYLPQTPESAILMNFGRGLSFVIGFFWLPMVNKIGFAWTWATLAIILLILWLPILALMKWGEGWRKRLGPPTFHQYT